MAQVKRNIGLEILDGIREIKKGDHGRVINVPAVAAVREETGQAVHSRNSCAGRRDIAQETASAGIRTSTPYTILP